jgi:hypothetical protein
LAAVLSTDPKKIGEITMPKLESKSVSSLRPDPNQPRKHFDEADLPLLGESLMLA